METSPRRHSPSAANSDGSAKKKENKKSKSKKGSPLMSSDLRPVSEVLNFPSAPRTSYAIEPEPSSSRPMPPPDDLNPTGKRKAHAPSPAGNSSKQAPKKKRKVQSKPEVSDSSSDSSSSSSESASSDNYRRLSEEMQAKHETLQQQFATSQMENSHQINQLTGSINMLLQYHASTSQQPPNAVPPLPVPAQLNATVAELGPGQAPTGMNAPLPSQGHSSESDQTLDSRSIMVTSTRLLVEKIPPELKQKIQSNKYLDFQELLDLASGKSVPSPKFTHDTNFPRPPKRSPISASDWTKTFFVFYSAYIEKHPHLSQSLLSYGHRIMSFMDQSIHWEAYDIGFRTELEIDCAKGVLPNWSELKMDLYLKNSSQMSNNQEGNNKFFPGRQIPTNQLSANIPPGFCFSFHSLAQRCLTRNCTYKHACPTCGKTHPVYFHNRREKNPSRTFPNRSINSRQDGHHDRSYFNQERSYYNHDRPYFNQERSYYNQDRYNQDYTRPRQHNQQRHPDAPYARPGRGPQEDAHPLRRR